MSRDYSDPMFMRPLAPLVLPAVYDDVLSYEEWLSKVIARLNEISDFVNNTIGDIDTLVQGMIDTKVADLQRQITQNKASLNTLKAELDALDEKLDADVAAAIAESKRYADDKIRQAIASLGDIDAKIALAKSQAIQTSEHYTDEAVAGLNTQIHSLRLSVKSDVARQLAVINTRIDNIIKEYPLLYDPATGFTEDMQTVIYNVYKALRTLAISAMMYDDQELTAEEYDNMNLKAGSYDVEMYRILFKDLREMFNPFTGKLSSLCDVVGDLVRRMQWNAKTTSEADGYDATASEFDASTFNAYEQDTNRYLTQTTPDVKNRKIQNLRYLGKAENNSFFDTGFAYADAIGKEFVVTYAYMDEFTPYDMASVSFVVNIGLADTPMRVVLPNIDNNVGFYVTMIDDKLYLDLNGSSFDFDVYVKTDVFDVTELDK